MDLFRISDFRQLLRSAVLAKKERHGRAYTFDKLAKACRVQKAYLSKILGGDGLLSEDQAYLAAGFLGFSAEERRYLLLLLSVERSAVPARRQELLLELELMRSQRLETSAHLVASASEVTTSDLADYYLEPNLQLLHMFMTIDRYQSHPAAAAADLGLSSAQAADLLDRLVKLGILAYEDGRYRPLRDDLHLPPQSPVYHAYRLLVRTQALARMTASRSPNDYNFSVFLSTDGTTRTEIQRRFLAFIKEAQHLVGASQPQQVFQLNFDLLQWTTSATRP